MKLIHTADVHLDASFAASGMPPAYGNRRRQSLRDTFARILRRAAEWPADAVLIAGDLFEHERVSRDTVAFLRQAFESVRPIPIFIAPGNHDPWVPSSPYATEPWPANVFIFNRAEWTDYALKNLPLTVHGFAFDGPDISRNPFGQLLVPRDGRVHVAVAHGSERNRQPAGKTAYAPFDARLAAPDGLTYLALGHFHRVTRIEGDFTAHVYYSGAPEGHGFDETGPHYYLEVEIDPEPRQVRVTPMPSSQTCYEVRTVDCTDFASAQDLVDALRALANGDGAAKVLRVRLTGWCAPALATAIENVHDVVAGAFEFLELINETQPEEDYAELSREDTSLGEFIRQMETAIHAAPDERIRRMLNRAREAGLAAYRDQELPIRGTTPEGG
jgi:DNA repair exonuclease SbcCD nuclease subunit